MLFKSPVFSQASGSLNGLTFSHNRGGMYTRNRSIPTNPQSNQQVAVRMYLSQAIGYWKNTFDASNRGTWDDYAANTTWINKLGDPVNLTGLQMWLRTAVPALQAGLAPQTLFANAPTNYDLGETGTLSITSVDDAGDITVGIGGTPAWAADDAAYILIFCSRPTSATINFFKGPYRFVGATSGDSGTPITSATGNLITTWPGSTPVAGNKAHLKLNVLQSDGRYSTGDNLSTVIVAA